MTTNYFLLPFSDEELAEMDAIVDNTDYWEDDYFWWPDDDEYDWAEDNL